MKMMYEFYVKLRELDDNLEASADELLKLVSAFREDRADMRTDRWEAVVYLLGVYSQLLDNGSKAYRHGVLVFLEHNLHGTLFARLGSGDLIRFAEFLRESAERHRHTVAELRSLVEETQCHMNEAEKWDAQQDEAFLEMLKIRVGQFAEEGEKWQEICSFFSDAIRRIVDEYETAERDIASSLLSPDNPIE